MYLKFGFPYYGTKLHLVGMFQATKKIRLPLISCNLGFKFLSRNVHGPIFLLSQSNEIIDRGSADSSAEGC